MALGVVLIIVGIVVVITGSLSKVNGFQRVRLADGSGAVTFSGTGGYVAYYEAGDVSSSTSNVPLIAITLTGPSGTTFPLTTPYGGRTDGRITKLDYDYNGHHGLALYQFHISEPGSYQVQLAPNRNAPPDAQIAFGRSIAAGTVAGALLVLAGVLVLVGGLVTLIVGLVKRSRHKRELATAGYWQQGWPPQQPQPWQQSWPPQQPQAWQQGWQPQPPADVWDPPSPPPPPH